MTNRLRLLCLVFMSLFYSGCTTTPTLTEYQVIEEYDEISSLKSRLAEDEVNGLFNLAPLGFASAHSKLAEAITLAQTRSNKQVSIKVTEGKQVLDKAESDATLSKQLMREVLEARQLAIAAGADAMFRDRFALLDSKLRKASKRIEKNDIESAKKWRP
ncbi:MAG: hypothetical protein KZQ86_00250, partial [Candidatus Thiodiazotropha sp. (ex Lucinoma kastoroae)]|nr:hypothetical protein [Candidatus Thiodiazotropha sp. (ex Lucinoma kastoroae)]